MDVQQLKALTRRGRSGLDFRSVSPKAKGDWSGVILGKTGSHLPQIQMFDPDVLAKIHVCNDVVWTCLELVSSTAALGKLKVRKRIGNEIEFLPDHPLQKMLDFPNPSMTQFDLIQSYVIHQRLYGTIGIILMRAGMTEICSVCLEDGTDDCLHKFYTDFESPIIGMMPIHINNIEQHKVTIEGKTRTYFFYVPEPNRKFIIHPDNILTDPFYNTTAGFWGISPTWLLKRWIDLDHSMTSQIQSLFDNGSIPSMIVSMKPGTNYTYEQEPATLMQMMKDKWVEQFNGKSGNQKTPAFVYGDVQVERLQEKIDSGMSKGLYYEIQEHICATFGVPPTLYEFGLRFGAQRASAQQHEVDFFNRTISKILVRFENKINQLVVPSYNEEGLEVVWDLSEMGIASFLIEAKKAEVRTDWELGLVRRDETRVKLGWEPTGDVFGNDYYRITVTDGGGANSADNRLKAPTGQESTPSNNSISPVKTIYDR